jgi:hypothetical protein
MQFPSTDSVVESLEHMKESPTNASVDEKMSDTGKRVHHDILNLSTATQRLIAEKNRDETRHRNDLLQNMIAHATNAAKLTRDELAKASSTADVGSAEEMRSHLTFAYMNLVTIIKMFVTSSEFRTLAKGLIGILMDIFKYNLGDSDAVHSQSVAESSGRDLAHRAVDVVADTTDRAMTKDPVAEEFSSDGSPHSNEESRSEKNAYAQMKERIYRFEVPQEHKEELLNRLKDNLELFQNRPNYQNTLEEFLNDVSNFVQATKCYSKNRMETGSTAIKQSKADSEWKEAFAYARSLLEQLFNSSLDPVISTWKAFYKDIMDDDSLYTWFQGWMALVKAMLHDAQYVKSEQFKQDAQILSQETRKALGDNYRDHAETFHYELSAFVSNVGQDPTTQDFIDQLRILWEDAFLDDNGNLTIKSELLDDLARIIPVLSDKIMFVPLPKYENDGDDLYIFLDQVVLNCKKLIPTHIKFGTTGTVNFSSPPSVDALLTLYVNQVQASANNAAFSFEKKTGMWKFGDSGRMDFDLYGDGLSLDLRLRPWMQRTPNGTEKGFDVVVCDVKLDKLNLRFHDMQNHTWRYKIFRRLIQRKVKKQLGTILSGAVRNLLDPNVPNDDNQDGAATSSPSHVPIPSSALTTSGGRNNHGNVNNNNGNNTATPSSSNVNPEKGIVSRFRGRRLFGGKNDKAVVQG